MFYLYCTVLSIEKIAKTTDIKFPKKTEGNSQQLTTHFTLPSEALRDIKGNYWSLIDLDVILFLTKGLSLTSK